MPHTHPLPQQRTPDSASLRHPLTAPNSSRYLSPVQEKRILSWRAITDPSPPVCETSKTKSAPASLTLSGESSSTSPCPVCAAKSLCSCSGYSPSKKSGRQKSYYSKKRSPRSGTMLSALTPMTPVQAYHSGLGMTPQYGQVPTVPMPEPALAAPPAEQPPPARIAGARDPITQNYWRQMFPPAVPKIMPLVQPGQHPPQMFGMGAGRPLGF